MCRKILREIVTLCLCLAIFPFAVILFAVHSDSLNVGLAFLIRTVLSVSSGGAGLSLAIVVRLIAPYLIVQCIRGFLWSQKSLTGRKWVNLYYAVLLTCLAAWALWNAWDLFSFMLELGDMPAEIMQFLEIEGDHVLVFLGSVVLGVHCFRIFLDPAGTRRPPANEG
jgi:hypothetical protein